MGTIIVLLWLLLLLILVSTFGGFMYFILLLLLLLEWLLLFWIPTLLRVHKRNEPSQSRSNFAECHHRYLLFIKLCVDKPFCDCQLIASAVSAYTALQKKKRTEKQKRHLGRASAGKGRSLQWTTWEHPARSPQANCEQQQQQKKKRSQESKWKHVDFVFK